MWNGIWKDILRRKNMKWKQKQKLKQIVEYCIHTFTVPQKIKNKGKRVSIFNNWSLILFHLYNFLLLPSSTSFSTFYRFSYILLNVYVVFHFNAEWYSPLVFLKHKAARNTKSFFIFFILINRKLQENKDIISMKNKTLTLFLFKLFIEIKLIKMELFPWKTFPRTCFCWWNLIFSVCDCSLLGRILAFNGLELFRIWAG